MDIRSKFCLIFEGYFDFGKKELTACVSASYSLNRNYCRLQ